MKYSETKDRQTLFDVAIRECGTAESAFDLAILNNVALTDDLEIGTRLALPSVDDSKVADYWSQNSIEAATGIEPTVIVDSEGNRTEVSLEGIGYWTIQGTFKVS